MRAILAPDYDPGAFVTFVWDNAVAISFVVGLVAVLAASGLLAVRGLRLYRTIKRSTRTLSAAAAVLADDAQRVAEASRRIPERQAEIRQAISDLQRNAAAVGVLARHALVARRILIGPLRYVGR